MNQKQFKKWVRFLGIHAFITKKSRQNSIRNFKTKKSATKKLVSFSSLHKLTEHFEHNCAEYMFYGILKLENSNKIKTILKIE
jgi:hypothetical protein